MTSERARGQRLTPYGYGGQTLVDTVAAAGLTLGTRRDDRKYVGVVRRGRTILAECGHRHTNRDLSTRTNGIAASDCIRRVVWAAMNPAYADEQATAIANAWRNLGRGWAVTTSLIEQAKAAAPADVAAYRELVAKVAAALDTEGAA